MDKVSSGEEKRAMDDTKGVSTNVFESTLQSSGSGAEAGHNLNTINTVQSSSKEEATELSERSSAVNFDEIHAHLENVNRDLESLCRAINQDEMPSTPDERDSSLVNKNLTTLKENIEALSHAIEEKNMSGLPLWVDKFVVCANLKYLVFNLESLSNAIDRRQQFNSSREVDKFLVYANLTVLTKNVEALSGAIKQEKEPGMPDYRDRDLAHRKADAALLQRMFCRSVSQNSDSSPGNINPELDCFSNITNYQYRYCVPAPGNRSSVAEHVEDSNEKK